MSTIPRIIGIIGLCLAAICGAAEPPPAPAAEQLEKAIYQQDTAGNLQVAIELYQQIIAASKGSSATAAEATYRLGQCLLTSGDVAAANASFTALLTNYGNQTAQCVKVLKHLQSAPLIVGAAKTGHRQTPDAAATGGTDDSAKAIQTMQEKLSSIIIPKVAFEDAQLSAVCKYLHKSSKALDPQGSGVNILLRPGTDNAPTVTLDFDNIPIDEVIRYICKATNMQFRVDANSVVIAGQNVPLDDMKTRFYQFDSGLMEASGGFGGEPGGDDTKPAKSPKEILTEFGVEFPPGSAVTYKPSIGKLIIKNTAEELAKIDRIFMEINVQPTQVKISAELIEVSDPRILELDPKLVTRSLIYQVPAAERKLIRALSVVTLSGNTSMVKDMVYGVRYVFEATPTVASDGVSIDLEINWSSEERDAPADGGAEIEEGRLVAETAYASRTILWDAESVVSQVSQGVTEDGETVPRYLVLSVALLNPAGLPVRAE